MISLAKSDTAMYSASADERAMVCCFLDLQEMGVMPNRATCPEMDLRVSTSVPQSESTYAESSLPVLTPLLYSSRRLGYRSRYSIKWCSADQCGCPGLDMWLASWLTVNEMSNLGGGYVCLLEELSWNSDARWKGEAAAATPDLQSS